MATRADQRGRGNADDAEASAGARLASGQRWILAGGLAVTVVILIGSVAAGDYRWIVVPATLAVLAPVLGALQRNHSRRRAAGEQAGAFGATCNVYFENLLTIPRFRSLLAGFRMPWWTKLPSAMPRMERSVMGGAVWIDGSAITWTPSSYRKRKGMQTLTVPLDDVRSVTRRPLVAVRSGGLLEVTTSDGSEWLLGLQDSDAAIAYLRHLGCRAPST
jgi:hypothetical protein